MCAFLDFNEALLLEGTQCLPDDAPAALEYALQSPLAGQAFTSFELSTENGRFNLKGDIFTGSADLGRSEYIRKVGWMHFHPIGPTLILSV
ncbi:MAG: hypothetical protein QNI89_11330 [Desulfobacterales bacterium]|nr:hypothetical protein [Desulfobacterales bacterium]